MTRAAPQSSEYTYSDYVGWDDDERWELIDGQVYAMSPAPRPPHQDLLVELITQIRTFLRGAQCKVFAAPFDVRLPDGDEPDGEVRTVVQPDISVICDLGKLDDRGCRGAPDWIVEILSPATAAKDHTVKRALYERHGVREYWLAHPTDRVVMVYRREDSGQFGPPALSAMEGTIACGVVDGLVIDWSLLA